MPEKTQPSIPLLDKLVSDLGSAPEGNLVTETLSQEDLTKLMGNIVTASITNDPKLVISPNLNIIISQQKGKLTGSIGIYHPLGGNSTVGLDMTFANSRTKANLIETVGSPVVRPNLDIRASAYLMARGISIPDEVRTFAADPNLSIFKLLQSQVEPKGQHLTYFQAQFTPDNKLELGFKARKATAQDLLKYQPKR